MSKLLTGRLRFRRRREKYFSRPPWGDESLGLLDIIRVKFAYHFRINYDLNLETAEFLELGLCDFGETLFSARH